MPPAPLLVVVSAQSVSGDPVAVLDVCTDLVDCTTMAARLARETDDLATTITGVKSLVDCTEDAGAALSGGLVLSDIDNEGFCSIAERKSRLSRMGEGSLRFELRYRFIDVPGGWGCSFAPNQPEAIPGGCSTLEVFEARWLAAL